METYNMAYSLETSSVKTIVPGAEVSGFADVVARQKISAVSSQVPILSAGEGIDISLLDGKTVITNNISAGDNISFYYDSNTNKIRIDTAEISAYQLSGGNYIEVSNDHVNRKTLVSYTGTIGDTEVNNVVRNFSANGTWLTAHQSLSNYYQKTDTSSKQQISAALQYVSSNAGHTYTGVAPVQVNNTTDQISINLSAGDGIDLFTSGGYAVVSSTGMDLSAGPGINMFSSGGYIVISASAGGAGFPMTSTDGSRNYQMDINSSAMYITTATGAAGATTKLTTPGIQYEAYPATDISASWKNVINAANNRSNCYCVTLNSNNTAVDLEDLSAYDRITVLHAQEYVDDDYYIRWNNNTKTVHSGEYIEMAKVNYNGNTVWTFITTGWYDDALWD